MDAKGIRCLHCMETGKDKCDFTNYICQDCYNKAEEADRDLDHWDLWELERNKNGRK